MKIKYINDVFNTIKTTEGDIATIKYDGEHLFVDDKVIPFVVWFAVDVRSK